VGQWRGSLISLVGYVHSTAESGNNLISKRHCSISSSSVHCSPAILKTYISSVTVLNVQPFILISIITVVHMAAEISQDHVPSPLMDLPTEIVDMVSTVPALSNAIG